MKKKSKVLRTKNRTRKTKQVIFLAHDSEKEINEAKKMIGYMFEKWRDSKYEP